jgi:hypothetical protein
MIHTILTPSNTDLHLSIPKDYVGKQIEILLYTTDEGKEEKAIIKKTRKLRGALKLSDKQYKDFQQHTKNTRSEWDRSI